MLRKNEGTVDRAIRVTVGAVLAPIGLFVLDGLQGSVVGIVAAAFGSWTPRAASNPPRHRGASRCRNPCTIASSGTTCSPSLTWWS
jgi:hypothetical protein